MKSNFLLEMYEPHILNEALELASKCQPTREVWISFRALIFSFTFITGPGSGEVTDGSQAKTQWDLQFTPNPVRNSCTYLKSNWLLCSYAQERLSPVRGTCALPQSITGTVHAPRFLLRRILYTCCLSYLCGISGDDMPWKLYTCGIPMQLSH